MPVYKEKAATRPARTREDEVDEAPTDVRNEDLEESTTETLDDIACCLADFDEVIEVTEKERVRAEYLAAEALRDSNSDEYVYRMQLLAEQYSHWVVFTCFCGDRCNFGWIGG
jgi:hypothetical protein